MVKQDRGQHHVKTPWRDISQKPGLGHIWAQFFFVAKTWPKQAQKVKNEF